MNPKDVEWIIVIYEEQDNRFYLDLGWPILNIQALITANELYLFRFDHGCCVFPHRYYKGAFIEICIEE